MGRVFAVAAAAVMAAALAGCFYSERELIGFWGADRGIEPGRYTHTPFNPEGIEWGYVTWEGEIGYSRRRYTSDAPNFPHEGARLRRMSGDIYLAQLPRRDGVGYGVVFVYPQMITYHMPDCYRMEEALREKMEIALDEEGWCKVDDLDQIERVMAEYLALLDGDVRIDGIYRRLD